MTISVNKQGLLNRCLGSQGESLKILQKITPQIQWFTIDGKSYASSSWLKKLGKLNTSTLGNLSARYPKLLYEGLGSIKLSRREEIDRISEEIGISASSYAGILATGKGINFLSPVTMLILLMTCEEDIGMKLWAEFGLKVQSRSGRLDLMEKAEALLRQAREEEADSIPPSATPVPQPPSPILRVIHKEQKVVGREFDLEAVYCDAAVFENSGLTTIAAFEPGTMRCIIRRIAGVMPISAAEVLAIQLAGEMRAKKIYTDHLYAVNAIRDEKSSLSDLNHPYSGLSRLPDGVELVWIPREKNWVADALTKRGLEIRCLGKSRVSISSKDPKDIVLESLEKVEKVESNSTSPKTQVEPPLWALLDAKIEQQLEEIQKIDYKIAEAESEIQGLEKQIETLKCESDKIATRADSLEKMKALLVEMDSGLEVTIIAS